MFSRRMPTSGHKRKRGKRAFTLIELIVVMVVIAVLAAIVVPKYAERTTEGKRAALKQNLQNLRSAIQSYQTDTGVLPSALTDLAGASAPTGVTGYQGPYLHTGVPVDPTTGSANWTYSATTGLVASSNASYSSW